MLEKQILQTNLLLECMPRIYPGCKRQRNIPIISSDYFHPPLPATLWTDHFGDIGFAALPLTPSIMCLKRDNLELPGHKINQLYTFLLTEVSHLRMAGNQKRPIDGCPAGHRRQFTVPEMAHRP